MGGATVISKWMVCSKRRSVFSHTQTVVHSGDVKKFLHTQARTGRHIVEACPQPSPNSFTRLSWLRLSTSRNNAAGVFPTKYLLTRIAIAIRVQTVSQAPRWSATSQLPAEYVRLDEIIIKTKKETQPLTPSNGRHPPNYLVGVGFSPINAVSRWRCVSRL